MAKAVFGLVDTESQAERIVDNLKVAGFRNNDISVLFPDKGGTRDFAHEKATKAPEGAAAGAGTGTVVGAAVGGLSGALIGLGIPEYEAKQYEGKIRQGNILISVHSEDRDEVKRAKEIFERAGAHDISSTGEESVPRKDKAAYAR